MNASKADQEVKQVVRDLLSRDAVKFNSIINAHFASSSTYLGRGLKITGASQLKHAAYLLNALNLGSAAKIDDRDVRWDAASSTAIVKATRFIRPAFFPLFQFAVPTKLVLTFNAEEGMLYTSLLVPLLTSIFLVISNVAFWLHARFESVEHKYGHGAIQAFRQKVQPRLPSTLVKGFDTGVLAAEQVSQRSAHVVSRMSQGPLRVVEELARTATVVLNLALPHQVQLPYPSVFAESAKAEAVKSDRQSTKESEKPTQDKPATPKSQSAVKSDEASIKSPNNKISCARGTAEDKKDLEHQQSSIDKKSDGTKQLTAEKPETDKPAPKPAANDAADEQKREAEPAPIEDVPHAKVVVGPSEGGSQQPQAKEFDIVTQRVTEKAPAEPVKASFYQALKKDDQLLVPTGGGSGGGGGKKSSGKKKGKNGGHK